MSEAKDGAPQGGGGGGSGSRGGRVPAPTQALVN